MAARLRVTAPHQAARLPGADAQETARAKDEDEEEQDMEDAIVDAVDDLARTGSGDVLVFLPGEREIRETAELLRKHHPKGAEIVPLYARLSFEEQDRVF